MTWGMKFFQVLGVVSFRCATKHYLFAAQIVSAVLSSIGLSNSVTGSEGMDVVRVSFHFEL